MTDDQLGVLNLTASATASAITALARSKETGTRRAMFIWGPPGIAKSAIAKQVANTLNMAFVDVRLSQMDPTDLRGMPFVTQRGNVKGIEWSAPMVLPRDIDHDEIVEAEAIDTVAVFYNPLGDNDIPYCLDPKVEVTPVNPNHTADIIEVGYDSVTFVLTENGQRVPGKARVRVTGKAKAIVALEEFNSAPQTVQAASYQLVLDKRLGAYKVPDGCYLLGMGNRENDRSITYTMGWAIANRFMHVEMKVENEEWLDWAVSNNIHPDIMGFIAQHPGQLHKAPEGNEASRGFRTPRSWEFASDILKDCEGEVSPDTLLCMLAGAVGDAGAAELHQYRAISGEVPKAIDICEGRVKPSQVADLCASGQFATIANILHQLVNDWGDVCRGLRLAGIEPGSDGYMRFLEAMPERGTWLKHTDTAITFVMDNFPTEMAIMLVHRIARVNVRPRMTLAKSPAFKECVNRHEDILTPAVQLQRG